MRPGKPEVLGYRADHSLHYYGLGCGIVPQLQQEGKQDNVEGMKIDCYTHFACPSFMDHLEAESGHPMVFRGLFAAIPELSDVELRIRYNNSTNMCQMYIVRGNLCSRFHSPVSARRSHSTVDHTCTFLKCRAFPRLNCWCQKINFRISVISCH